MILMMIRNDLSILVALIRIRAYALKIYALRVFAAPTSDDAPPASTFIRSYFIESIGTRSCNKEAVRKPSKRATRVTSVGRNGGHMRKGREAGGTNGPGYIDTFVSARRQIDAIARKRGSLPVAVQKSLSAARGRNDYRSRESKKTYACIQA